MRELDIGKLKEKSDKLKLLGLEKLKELFIKNFRNAVKKECKNSAIMFSGGVDSTTMAVVAKEYCNPILITVGLKGSQDLEYAEKISHILSLEWIKKEIDENELTHYFNICKKILGDYLKTRENRLMEVELAIPLYICCRIAKENKKEVLFNGQGAEELFGGYERHLIEFKKDKPKAEQVLWGEIKDLPETNLKRNKIIADYVGIKAAYPFLDEDVICTAMAMPIDKKMSKNGEKKIILREIAKEMGVPEIAYKRPKKAAQYGSGIHKTVVKLIKKGIISI